MRLCKGTYSQENVGSFIPVTRLDLSGDAWLGERSFDIVYGVAMKQRWLEYGGYALHVATFITYFVLLATREVLHPENRWVLRSAGKTPGARGWRWLQ